MTTEKQAARFITNEMIAKRAYEIYQAGKGGTPSDHWFQAERELKSEAGISWLDHAITNFKEESAKRLDRWRHKKAA